MSGQNPTPWLSEGSGASSELRSLLQSAHRDEPTDEQLRGLSSRMAPLLVASVATAAVGVSSSAAAASASVGAGQTAVAAGGVTAAKVGLFSTVAAKLALSTTVAVAVAGGAYQVRETMTERRQREPAVPLMVRAPAPRAVAGPAEVAPVVLEPMPPKPAVRPAPVVSPKPSGSSAEVALLEEAMGALRSGDTEQALRLTERHARDFSDGALVQEREVLAIQALVQAGRTVEARSRAQRFKERFAGSTHLLKIDSLLH